MHYRNFAPLLIVVALAAGPASAQNPRLKTYQTKYYVIYSDLDESVVRDAEHRITAMAEEYHARTKSFAGAITKKLPFYLFSKPEDYYAAGGMQGSAGVFNGKQLMAIFSEKMGDDVWRVVQHEGFHQFVHAVIGGDMPIWVNEGLAEYFGESIFTGDGYVTGVILPGRLARLRLWISKGHAASISDMMNMAHETWNTRLTIVDYDQAWSMVYFLAHGGNGRYQKPLNEFIRKVSRGTAPREAWNATFGSGTREFERQWKEYWTSLDPNPTADKYAEATVATMTSYFARAFSQKQFFTTPDEFFKAAAAGQLRANKSDWLPSSLLERELPRAEKLGRWTFTKRQTGVDVRCDVAGGASLVGTFRVAPGGRVQSVSVKAGSRKSRD